MNNNIIQFKIAKEKDGDTIMCTALERIRGKTPKEILEKYDLNKSIPVDIEKLLRSLNISAISKDFSYIESSIKIEQGTILGMLISSGDNAAIFYRSSDTYNRKRFTIAHELAHAIIHNDNSPHIEFRMNEDEIENNPIEKEANILAGEFLIPFNLLKEIYFKLPIPSSVTLATIFKVSVNVMEARLNHLGISYFNSNGKAITYGE